MGTKKRDNNHTPGKQTYGSSKVQNFAPSVSALQIAFATNAEEDLRNIVFIEISYFTQISDIDLNVAQSITKKISLPLVMSVTDIRQHTQQTVASVNPYDS